MKRQRDKKLVELERLEQERIYAVPCFDMDSKEYIKRDDPEAKKFESIRLKATVARNVPLEETRPNFALEN